MPPAGGDDGAGEDGGRPISGGIGGSAACGAGQDQAESRSRKRKPAVTSGDSGSLVGNGAHLNVPSEDSRSILEEIKDLRAQLDKDVKEFGYCEANQKLRVELALKVKEIQFLRKQKEEMQVKYDVMRKPNGNLQAKNDGLAKHNEELQAKNDRLVTDHEVLKNSNDDMKKWNRVLQVKNDDLMKQSEELHAKIDGLTKQNEDLQAKNDGLAKHNEMLKDSNVGLTKRREELVAKNDSLTQWNHEMQAKSGLLTKGNEELQAKNNSLNKQNEKLKAKNDGLMKLNVELQANNDKIRKWNMELQANNDGIHKNGLKDGLTGCTDIETTNSRDIIPESVLHLKKPEPTLCQAASSFKDISYLRAQVTNLKTAVDQLMSNNHTPVKIKAALKELIDDYGADLNNTIMCTGGAKGSKRVTPPSVQDQPARMTRQRIRELASTEEGLNGTSPNTQENASITAHCPTQADAEIQMSNEGKESLSIFKRNMVDPML
nr:unnamed protein product [Digitaria exilis]